jgi:predicted membrane chloride channel (bestrophin family)
VRKSPWVLFMFVLIGGLLGGILGEILHVMAPQGTNLVLIKLVLGFSVKVNILSVLGMFIGIYLYKHV